MPIAKINVMYDDKETGTSQVDFATSGLKMKDYPCAIVDIRGNRGERLEAGIEWIRNYTNNTVQIRGAQYYLNNGFIKELNKLLWGADSDYIESVSTRLQGKKGEKVQNDNLLFVLIDKDTASAGESFVEELMNLDNVILVGTNTNGKLLTGNVSYYKLKYSNITVRFGNMLYMPPHYDELEFNGFQPDIVIESNDALTRVKKLIKYYNLDKNKK